MKKDVATFGGGCFWCIEAVIQRLIGVEEVVSGFAGGLVPGTPTYREVCSGLTGHAEVVQVVFDMSLLTYEELLRVFMTSHDPTTTNGKGEKYGSQYRSLILYHNDRQKEIAKDIIQELKPFFEKPIETSLEKMTTFFPAEATHQNYYNENTDAGYCKTIIDPKLKKLKELYSNKLKSII